MWAPAPGIGACLAREIGRYGANKVIDPKISLYIR